jgi:hypothetical protein
MQCKKRTIIIYNDTQILKTKACVIIQLPYYLQTWRRIMIELVAIVYLPNNITAKEIVRDVSYRSSIRLSKERRNGGNKLQKRKNVI